MKKKKALPKTDTLLLPPMEVLTSYSYSKCNCVLPSPRLSFYLNLLVFSFPPPPQGYLKTKQKSQQQPSRFHLNSTPRSFPPWCMGCTQIQSRLLQVTVRLHQSFSKSCSFESPSFILLLLLLLFYVGSSSGCHIKMLLHLSSLLMYPWWILIYPPPPISNKWEEKRKKYKVDAYTKKNRWLRTKSRSCSLYGFYKFTFPYFGAPGKWSLLIERKTCTCGFSFLNKLFT